MYGTKLSRPYKTCEDMPPAEPIPGLCLTGEQQAIILAKFMRHDRILLRTRGLDKGFMGFVNWFKKNKAVELAEKLYKFKLVPSIQEYEKETGDTLSYAELDLAQDLTVFWITNLSNNIKAADREESFKVVMRHPLLRDVFKYRREYDIPEERGCDRKE